MRIVQRLVLVLWAIFAAGAACAQDAGKCAEIEKQLGAKPLQMLGFLDRAECLGGAKDAALVTVSVRRLLPDAAVPPEQLGEVPNVARAALGQVSDYLAGAMPAHGQSARALLAVLANEIDAVRAKLARNQTLGELDAKGWEWNGTRMVFLGLPSLDMKRLDVNCAQEADVVCREAASTGKVVFRAAALVKQALRFSLEETYQQALDAARVRDAKWTGYFDEARLQYPWELLLNGWRHRRENRKAGGFADVPNDQWILLHPGVGLEYVRNAPQGSRFEPALVVEIVGYNRWSWTTGGGMGRAYGVSLIQTYSDRAGLGSARPGIMFHINNRFSLALTREGGETGVMLSLDLSKLVSKVEEDARSRFRLLGSGRMAD
jgi:hypothetical protein